MPVFSRFPQFQAILQKDIDLRQFGKRFLDFRNFNKKSLDFRKFYPRYKIIPEGLLSPKSYVDVPAGPRNFDFHYTNFLPNYTPISIPILLEKHLIWPKLGAFSPAYQLSKFPGFIFKPNRLVKMTKLFSDLK